jgi:DNA-binding response OmpR family regulator
MQETPARVLIVDDDEACLGPPARLLRLDGFDVRCAPTAARAFWMARAEPPDLLVTNLDFADGDGCKLLRRVRSLHPHVRGVAVSNGSGRSTRSLLPNVDSARRRQL